MKKGFFRTLAITLSVIMMLTVCIITTASAEEVVTDYTALLPEYYEVADKIFDVANESNARVSAKTNWNYWGGSAAYPTLEDQYGLNRSSTDYASLDIAVNSATEYFAVGMMIDKSYFQNGKCDNYYYTSADGETWRPIMPVGTAVPEACPLYSINFADTNYRFEVDVVGNLPEDTKYFRVVSFCPNAVWTPILDFINVYDLGYDYAASLYPESPAVSIEEPKWDTADMALVNATVSNLEQKAAGLNYRSETNTFGLTDHSQPGYVTLDANYRNSVETVVIYDKRYSMSVSFEYTSSTAADAEWLPLESGSVAWKKLNNADAASTSVQGNDNYELRAYRAYNLPEDIVSLRIKLVGTTSATWVPHLDYIDVYEKPLIDDDETRFAAVFNGYNTAATTVIESYAQFTASSLAIGTPVGLQAASDSTRNYRTTDTNFITPSANAKGNLAFMVDDSQAIETATVFDEGSSNIASMSIEFFYTTDINASEPVWTALPTDSIAKTKTLSVKSDGTTAFTGNYKGYVYRLFDLPEGTEGIQIVLGAKTWAPTIDYIDIYDVATDLTDTARFDAALKDYTIGTTIESYSEFTESSLAIGAPSGLQHAADSNRNYRSTNTSFITPSAAAKGYLAFKVNDSQVVETTTVFDESASNIASMSIEFFYTVDADADTIVWQPMPISSIAKTDTLSVKSDGVTAMYSNYRAYTYRLFDLPEGIEGIKIMIGSKTWAPTIDYIDIYDLNTAAEGRFDAAFDDFATVENKKYFEDNRAITTEGYVVDYSNVGVYSAGLGTSEGNYVKAVTADGGYVVIEVQDENVVETGLVVHKGYLNTTYLTYYVSNDNSNWTVLSKKNVATTEALCTTIAETPNSTDYYLRRERIKNLPEGTKYLKVEITTATAWQPGLDFINVYDTACKHTFTDWLYNPVKHTVEKFCENDNTFIIKGNVVDTEEVSDTLDILDVVMMNAAAGDAEVSIDTELADTDASGVIDAADVTWLRKFMLRKIYG